MMDVDENVAYTREDRNAMRRGLGFKKKTDMTVISIAWNPKLTTLIHDTLPGKSLSEKVRSLLLLAFCNPEHDNNDDRFDSIINKVKRGMNQTFSFPEMLLDYVDMLVVDEEIKRSALIRRYCLYGIQLLEKHDVVIG
jgi:hypothetical protein